MARSWRKEFAGWRDLRRAKPRGSLTVVSPSRGLLRSDNAAPVRVSAVSHRGPVAPSLRRPKPRLIRNHLFSREAEAPFDPRPHVGAEAPRCVPVQNRDSVQAGGPPEGISPVTS
jgi:hypothetical protein